MQVRGMSSPARRNRVLVVLLLILLAVVALLWSRCQPPRAEPPAPPPPAPVSAVAPPPAPPAESRENPGGARPPEVLGEAALSLEPVVLAGADFEIRWTGPDNEDDYLTIVAPEAPAYSYGNYTMTRRGNPASLPAPVEAGGYEVRYVAGRSKTVLARAPLEVTAAAATLEAPASAPIGSQIPVKWTGPDNKDDYITIVPAGTEDGRHGNYAYTSSGSPLEVRAPVEDGPAELRYHTGRHAKVLARRAILLTVPAISLSAPAEVVEGGNVSIEWSGPANRGDYITVVPKDLPDGRYGNNNDISRGSPLRVRAPMGAGPGEIRYMTAQGGRVLARRDIGFLPARITLEAVEAAEAGSTVEIVWTGPVNGGDYLTIVPAGAPDAQVGRYADAERGSPSRIAMPAAKGPAEIRYVSGQGRIVLGRRAIESK